MVSAGRLPRDLAERVRDVTRGPAVFFPERTSLTVAALYSSLNLRRCRRSLLGFPSSIVDTVSAFRQVSTRPDQAQTAAISVVVIPWPRRRMPAEFCYRIASGAQ